ncbi:MAG: WS/DGAT/MGAT family O-acyltransferase [Nitriliruptorales bacterium]
MGKGHGERLGVLDSTFLRIESETEHMHTAGLFLFEPSRGDEFEFSRFLDLVRSRLHLVPRFRQRLAFPPLNLTTPIWIDDEEFDVSYHVRHAALPRPGRTDQLMEYVGRLISRPLDRSRPLWELYVVEGLEEERVAYLGKTHHAMIDGVTGIDIATLLLDAEEDAGEIPPPEPWTPASAPSDLELAAAAAGRLLTSPRALVERIQGAVDRPRQLVRDIAQIGEGIASIAPVGVSRGPRSPLNSRNGSFRRFAIQRLQLEDAKRVKDSFGTTVNDVILAIVGDAVGRFLRARGEDTRGVEMKVMVPVSVRADGDETLFGNRVSSVFVWLPVDQMDPVDRLRSIHDAMRGVKEHRQAVGAEFLVNLSGYAPPTIHALAARTAARTRVYNFVVTNVPGPQIPLYSLGMRLMGAFPVVPLPQKHSFAVGVTSIDGWLNFGFTGDWDTLPDLENVCGGLVEALQELVKHADAAGTRHELTNPS